MTCAHDVINPDSVPVEVCWDGRPVATVDVDVMICQQCGTIWHSDGDGVTGYPGAPS